MRPPFVTAGGLPPPDPTWLADLLLKILQASPTARVGEQPVFLLRRAPRASTQQGKGSNASSEPHCEGG